MKTCSKTWISHHSNDLDYLLVVAVVALVLVTFRDTLGGSSSRKRTRTNSLHHVFLVAFVLFVFLFDFFISLILIFNFVSVLSL